MKTKSAAPKKAKMTRYTIEQKAKALKEYPNKVQGLTQFCAKHGISVPTYYNWKKEVQAWEIAQESLKKALPVLSEDKIPMSTMVPEINHSAELKEMTSKCNVLEERVKGLTLALKNALDALQLIQEYAVAEQREGEALAEQFAHEEVDPASSYGKLLTMKTHAAAHNASVAS